MLWISAAQSDFLLLLWHGLAVGSSPESADPWFGPVDFSPAKPNFEVRVAQKHLHFYNAHHLPDP